MFVPDEPTILHADLDAFYASVEQRDEPSLRGRPVIVGGGVVLAASYEAKACGVRTAMGGARARALCPRAVVVPPRFAAYTEASKQVFAVFERTSPLVEALSIDEAFLDVRGLRHISGHADGDRGAITSGGARGGGAGHHRRPGLHEVPGQGGERGGQARRTARGPRGRRAGLSASAAGRAAVGGGRGDGGQAARARADLRGAGGAPGRADAGVDAGPGRGAPALRALAQPGRAARDGAAQAAVDRGAAGTRAAGGGRPRSSTPR